MLEARLGVEPDRLGLTGAAGAPPGANRALRRLSRDESLSKPRFHMGEGRPAQPGHP